MKKLLLFSALLFPLAALSASLPSPSISSSVGVSMHLNNIGGASDYAMMAAAGIKVVRTDLQWDQIETSAGSYTWTQYDNFVNSVVANGMRPLLILDYSNPLYEGPYAPDPAGPTYAPQVSTSITAFTNWAKAAVAHFNDRTKFPKNPNIIWEIYNEPNLGNYWVQDPHLANSGGTLPTPVSQYISLASSVCSGIKAVDPNATVIGPAAVSLPEDYLNTFLSSGILSCLDAVSVHPYRGPGPETVLADTPAAGQLNFQSLRSLINANTPGGRGVIPIISGEWGYGSTLTFGQPQQAQNLVRMQLANLYGGIPLSVWYDWKDDGSDLTQDEQNYGLVQYASSANTKTSYTALKTLTTELAGYELQSRIPMSSSQDYVLLFKNSAGNYRLAMWTTGNIHLVAPNPSGTPFAPTSTVSMTGTRSSLIYLFGSPVSILLTASPQYIE